MQSVQALQEENAKLRKELDKLSTQLVQQMTADLESEIQSHKGISLLCKEVNLNASGMKDAYFKLEKPEKIWLPF